MTTALEWYRRHNDTAAGVPTTPVGPDLAEGLSMSFADDALDALSWDDLIMVNALLVHGDRGPLPALAVVEMEAENQCRSEIIWWPNYNDDVSPGWRQLIAS